MGSLVVKLDKTTQDKLKNRFVYSDVDMLTFRGDNSIQHANDSIVKLHELPMSYGIEAVKLSIRNILMWKVGESILRPEFGHRLHFSMYSQMDDYNRDKVAEEVKRAIEENEPRANIKTVALQPDEENNTMNVKVVYTVVGNQVEDAEITQDAAIQLR